MKIVITPCDIQHIPAVVYPDLVPLVEDGCHRHGVHSKGVCQEGKGLGVSCTHRVVFDYGAIGTLGKILLFIVIPIQISDLVAQNLRQRLRLVIFRG